MLGVFFNRDTAALDNGTRCSLPIFMRSAGMVQTAFSKLNSDHLALNVSLERTAQRMVSASAFAEISGLVSNSGIKAGTSFQSIALKFDVTCLPFSPA